MFWVNHISRQVQNQNSYFKELLQTQRAKADFGNVVHAFKKESLFVFFHADTS